jgi:hypothetical protein
MTNVTESMSELMVSVQHTPELSLLAYLQFIGDYPDIEYIPETDSYLYRGRYFDYFVSGTSIDNNSYSFMLRDSEDGQWLFTYGDKEDRWSDFLDFKRRHLIKPTPKPKENIFDKILGYLK